MLKILLFSPKGAGEHYYGPGMNAFRMYRNLNRDDVSVTLLHGYKEQEDLELFDEQVFISEIVNKNIFLGLKFLYKVKKWIKKNAHRFDVVHCLTAFQHSFMVSLWFEREGVPVFIKIGQSDHTGFYNNSSFSKFFGLRRFRLSNANNITGYISISREIWDKLEKANIEPGRIHDIPNGVDTERYKPIEKDKKMEIRRQLGLENNFTIIFTGAFSERKNPMLVVKAFHRFIGFENSQLLLIGPDTDVGTQRRKINEYIKKHSIGQIIVKDFVKNIEMYYQASDLFVLPSSQEGFSNSMLEAQACGLPAIVTPVSGATDLIDESKNGAYIQRDPKIIAKAFNQYFENSDKLSQHSEQAREIVEKKYSAKSVLNQYLNAFEGELKLRKSKISQTN